MVVAAAIVLSLRAPAAFAQQPTISLLDYQAMVPKEWITRAPSTSMRLAEYVVPPTGSSHDSAEVVVYFFGKGQGGNVDANLARWKGQFSTPDGAPVPEKITHDSAGSIRITFADYRGTYARGIGAGDPSQAKPNQELLAGIAETPRGTLFMQLFGPADRVTAESDTFKSFVKSLR